MRSLINILLLLFIALNLQAQQEPLLSQFAFNKDFFNPASTTGEGEKKASALYRNQWSGLKGAPLTQMFSYVNPDSTNTQAWGVYLQRHTIGIQERLDFSGTYAYQIPIKTHKLNIGARLSSRRYTIDYTSPDIIALNGIEADPNLQFERISSNNINFGLSVYYKSKNFYAGFFVDRLLNNMLSTGDNAILNQEQKHYYAMAGVNFNINEKWKFHPQTLLKISENTPFNLDILSLFTYGDNLNLGINIRSGGAQRSVIESFNYIMGFNLTENIFAGLSYDITVSNISDAENGSLEVMLRYHFNKKDNLPVEDNGMDDTFIAETIVEESITKNKDQNIPEPEESIIVDTLTIDTSALLAGKTMVMDDIYYAFDSYEIDTSATDQLDQLVDFMLQYPKVDVQLSSYTDSRGSREYNLVLSERRAFAVKQYLTSHGVEGGRITAYGMGEQGIRNHCKEGVECTDEEHNFNRRTEVKLINY